MIGFVYHFNESLASPASDIWVEPTELVAVICGAFMLRGHNWARWTAIGWIAFHVILSAFIGFLECAVHALLCAVIAWLLFRPAASRYFRPALT